MKLFLEYLKYHIKSIGMFLGFSVIFTGVFLLYHLPSGRCFLRGGPVSVSGSAYRYP